MHFSALNHSMCVLLHVSKYRLDANESHCGDQQELTTMVFAFDGV